MQNSMPPLPPHVRHALARRAVCHTPHLCHAFCATFVHMFAPSLACHSFCGPCHTTQCAKVCHALSHHAFCHTVACHIHNNYSRELAAAVTTWSFVPKTMTAENHRTPCGQPRCSKLLDVVGCRWMSLVVVGKPPNLPRRRRWMSYDVVGCRCKCSRSFI